MKVQVPGYFVDERRQNEKSRTARAAELDQQIAYVFSIITDALRNNLA